MNFIKTSKFSVKGIDTTRYISNEVRNLLSSIERGKSPLRTDRILVVLSVVKDLRLTPKRLKIFWVELEEGKSPPPPLKGGDPSLRSG